MRTWLRPFHVRVAALAALITLLTGLIGWSAHASWMRFAEMREGLRLAQLFEEQAIGLFSELRRLAAAADTASLQDMAARSRELAAWIEEERLDPTTERERRLLERTAEAYRGYLSAMEELASRPAPSAAEHPGRVAVLEERLSRVLRDSLAEFLDEVQRGLALRQFIIFALLALMLVFLVWFSFSVYRGMIAPLRERLVEADAAIEQSQKLASLGVLAAGIAHEIRNPLTAIKARLFTYQRALDPGSAAHQDVEFISRELNRLERIVRDFLLFARPAEPALAPVSTNALLRSACDLLAIELARTSIRLECDETVDLRVRADPEHIEQVLVNLVRNAAESMDPARAGRVVLRTRAARLPLRGVARDVAVLEVADNGRGIPTGVRKKLFDPFFTTKPTGTGLGLAIAARIVEKHGGALRFQTTVDRGTTFGVVLPLDAKS